MRDNWPMWVQRMIGMSRDHKKKKKKEILPSLHSPIQITGSRSIERIHERASRVSVRMERVRWTASRRRVPTEAVVFPTVPSTPKGGDRARLPTLDAGVSPSRDIYPHADARRSLPLLFTPCSGANPVATWCAIVEAGRHSPRRIQPSSVRMYTCGFAFREGGEKQRQTILFGYNRGRCFDRGIRCCNAGRLRERIEWETRGRIWDKVWLLLKGCSVEGVREIVG